MTFISSPLAFWYPHPRPWSFSNGLYSLLIKIFSVPVFIHAHVHIDIDGKFSVFSSFISFVFFVPQANHLTSIFSPLGKPSQAITACFQLFTKAQHKKIFRSQHDPQNQNRDITRDSLIRNDENIFISDVFEGNFPCKQTMCTESSLYGKVCGE